MFDIGLSEIVVIALVAVVVVGPERLPKVVRTLAHLMGRAQRYVGEIKSEIQREMEVEEIRNIRQSVQDVGKNLEATVRSSVDEVRSSADDLGKDMKGVGDSVQSISSELKDIANAKQLNTPDAALVPTKLTDKAPATLQGEIPLSIPEVSAETQLTTDAGAPTLEQLAEAETTCADDEPDFADGGLPEHETAKLPEVAEPAAVADATAVAEPPKASS